MTDYSVQNKKAWEYNAYEFWVRQAGTPSERAKKDIENPVEMLKRYSKYFDVYKDIRIANICGSCGKKAIPLALLGADVTIFDISEDNRKYALEVADVANVNINFEVCDVLEINMEKYKNYFDVVFMEGGILHYFHDINEFMNIMYSLLKNSGKMIKRRVNSPFWQVSNKIKITQPNHFMKSADLSLTESAREAGLAIRWKRDICLPVKG